MQITRTRSKYYVLSVLGALIVAMGVLAVAPLAQAQTRIEPTIDKECTPNPVQIGQQITCTIDVEAAPNTFIVIAEGGVTDTLPPNVRVTGATAEVLPADFTVECAVSGNTVTCPAPGSAIGTPGTFRVVIEATAVQCGTLPNTARAEGEFQFPIEEPFTVEDTENISVVGCEEAGGGAGGGAAPITQESEQESEAGKIDQSFDVS